MNASSGSSLPAIAYSMYLVTEKPIRSGALPAIKAGISF